jgi:hypothetical protein
VKRCDQKEFPEFESYADFRDGNLRFLVEAISLMSPKRQKQMPELRRVYDLPVLCAEARLSEAGSAGAPILRSVRVHRMGAGTANKPSILISDHRTELYANHAMGTADDQDGVDRDCSLLLHISTTARREPIALPNATDEEH